MKKVYVVNSESVYGDENRCLGVFSKRPNDSRLKELTSHENLGDDGWGGSNGDGDGHFGSWVFIEVKEVSFYEG